MILRHIDVGTSSDMTIGDLARMMADVAGFKSSIGFDSRKPDGTMRKLLMNVSRLADMGWQRDRLDLNN